MAEPVGGAVLGIVFAEFWNAVKTAKDCLKDFKPRLRDLQETLPVLVQVIEHTERINTQLNDEQSQYEAKRLLSMMEEGKKLVSKCTGISRLNFIKKLYYQKKLVELENKIISFNNKYIQLRSYQKVSQVHLQVNNASDRIERQLRNVSDQITSLQSSINPDVAGPSGMMRPPYLIPEGDNRPTINLASTNELVDLRDLDLSNPRPLETPQGPRPPSIGIFGLIFSLLLPGEAEILKIISSVTVIYEVIKSMLEKSESGIWMIMNDVGMMKTTIEQLDTTMRSLVHVPEEIGSNSEQLLMNEIDRSEAAERLRSLMEEGDKLVYESSNIGWWNFVKKWQYQKKMVELDNKLLKIQFVIQKVNMDAARFRNKPFPHYKEFHDIYEKDRATRKDAQTCEDVLEELHDHNGLNGLDNSMLETNLEADMDFSHANTSLPSNNSLKNTETDHIPSDASSELKRGKGKSFDRDNVLLIGMEKLVNSLSKGMTDAIEHLGDRGKRLDGMKESFYDELMKIEGLSHKERVLAYIKMLSDEGILIGFFSMPQEAKVDMIRQIIG